MDDFEVFFEEAVHENSIAEPTTLAERIISEAEAEFRNYESEEQSRQNEEKEIREDLKRLEFQMTKNKNIKNYRLRYLNDKRSQRRKEIKREIAELNLRLQEINMERGKGVI